jgi:hypothetical protein
LIFNNWALQPSSVGGPHQTAPLSLQLMMLSSVGGPHQTAPLSLQLMMLSSVGGPRQTAPLSLQLMMPSLSLLVFRTALQRSDMA